MRTRQFRFKMYLARLIGLDPDNDHAVWVTREHRAPIANTVCAKLGRHQGFIQTQTPLVVRDRARHWKFKLQISKSQVTRKSNRVRHERLLGQALGLFLVAFEQQFPNRLQMLMRIRSRIGVRLAAIECVFVKLNPLFGDPTEDHRPQGAITNGKCIRPLLCGSIIIQLQLAPVLRSCHKRNARL